MDGKLVSCESCVGGGRVKNESEHNVKRTESVGGRLCLDFANTVEPRRGGPGRDHLAHYADLVLWALHAGGLSGERAERLLDEAGRQPREARAAFRRALALREAIYRAFAAVVRGEEPQGSDLEALARANAAAAKHSRIIRDADGFAWGWIQEADLDRPLWPLARCAVELLTGGALERLKECPAEEGGCGWLFFDESKNRSRRWCSMADCGSKAKMRRLYARRHGRDSSTE